MSKHLADPTPHTVVVEAVEQILTAATGTTGAGGRGERRAVEGKYDHIRYTVVEAA